MEPVGVAHPTLPSGLGLEGSALATSAPVPPVEGTRGVDSTGGGVLVSFSLDPTLMGRWTTLLRSGVVVPAVGLRLPSGALLRVVLDTLLSAPAPWATVEDGAHGAGRDSSMASSDGLLAGASATLAVAKLLPRLRLNVALLAGSSSAVDGAAPAAAAGPAPPLLPAASAMAAVGAGVFTFSANGTTAGM
ncbi:hypothetical protein DUI87_22424 [Hirundo rustica rustica]|uniref:Uncharacterized protein n=1 Tax=Hirundo rustica rustica TaxID=333673 RepID=A0A3M0JKC1_HIRRU|nr:hypothetical protein DUI87_22424 [Hirundo rustica rustica]